MKATISLLIVCLLFGSCQPRNQHQATAPDSTLPIAPSPDTLYQLLNGALLKDSVTYDHYKPFLYIKTGNFLAADHKNALLVRCPADSAFQVELYDMQDHKWIKTGEIDGLPAFPIQFDALFEDYDFDGQKDIFIQHTVSNGHALAYGHLLIVDPATQRPVYHEETKALANLRPDAVSKQVFSEEMIYPQGREQACMLTNKWVNGKLQTVKKACPGETPNQTQTQNTDAP